MFVKSLWGGSPPWCKKPPDILCPLNLDKVAREGVQKRSRSAGGEGEIISATFEHLSKCKMALTGVKMALKNKL